MFKGDAFMCCCCKDVAKVLTGALAVKIAYLSWMQVCGVFPVRCCISGMEMTQQVSQMMLAGCGVLFVLSVWYAWIKK